MSQSTTFRASQFVNNIRDQKQGPGLDSQLDSQDDVIFLDKLITVLLDIAYVASKRSCEHVHSLAIILSVGKHKNMEVHGYIEQKMIIRQRL